VIIRTVLAAFFALFSLQAASAQAGDLDREQPHQICRGADAKGYETVDHFVFFPSESAAKEAASALNRSDVKHQVHKAATEESWVLFVAHLQMPDLEDFEQTRTHLTSVASSAGGRYGWYSCMRYGT